MKLPPFRSRAARRALASERRRALRRRRRGRDVGFPPLEALEPRLMLSGDPITLSSFYTAAHQGATYYLKLPTTAPDQSAISDWVVNWGDGSSNEYAGPFTSDEVESGFIIRTHTYTTGSVTRDISGTATSNTDTFGTNALSVNVLGPAPVLALSGGPYVLVDSSNPDFYWVNNRYTVGLSVTNDGSLTNWTLESNRFGNGNPVFNMSQTSVTAPVTPAMAPPGDAIPLQAYASDAAGTYYSNTLSPIVLPYPNVTVVGSGVAEEGSPYTIDLSASFPMSSDPYPESSWHIDWGDGTGDDYPADTMQASHTYADGPGGYDIDPAVTVAGYEGVLLHGAPVSVAVQNVAPTPMIVGYIDTSPEHELISLGSFVHDDGVADRSAGYSYAWSVTKDGAPYAAGTDPSFGFTPDDNAAFQATLAVTDRDGGVGYDSKVITILNVAPTLFVAILDADVEEGSPAHLQVLATDAGADTISGWSVAWGDGASDQAPGDAASIAHTYDDGTRDFTINVTASDEDGSYEADPLTLSVHNVAPSVAITSYPTEPLPEGTDLLLASSVSDPSQADTARGLVYTWSLTRNGEVIDLPQEVAHAAELALTPDDGDYVVTLSVGDKDGDSASDTRAFTVFNVAPSVVVTGVPQTAIDEGASVTLSAAVTDPGPLDNAHGFTYAWSVTRDAGPWSPPDGAEANAADFTFAPDDNGDYCVTLTVGDGADSVTVGPLTFTVNNVAPSVAITLPEPGATEGAAVTLTSSVGDAGAADVVAGLGYAWRVQREGEDYALPDDAVTSAPSFTFTPDDNANYTVSLTVTDKDGGAGIGTQMLAVINIAPLLIIAAPGEAYEGFPYYLRFRGRDVGQDTISSWSIQWGDGADAEGFDGAARNAAHTYTDGYATHSIVVTATDEDGSYQSNPIAVAVYNVDPVVSVSGDVTALAGLPYALNLNANDPGDDTVDHWVVDWGDGADGHDFETFAGHSESVTHVYAQSAVRYQVSAVATDEDGTYAATGFQVLVVPQQPPAAPSGLTAAAAADGHVALNWTDPSSGQAGFKIERAIGEGDYEEIATLAPGHESYTDFCADEFVRISYCVRAFDSQGESISAEADCTTMLLAPTGLSATDVTETGVTLAWVNSSAWATMVEIEQSINGMDYTTLVDLDATATSFAVSSLAPATSYSFRLRALNGSNTSAFSNTAAATTPAALSVGVAGVPQVNEGEVFSLILMASDAARLDGWVIQWGDGTQSTAAPTDTVTTHTYSNGTQRYRIDAAAASGPRVLAANPLPVTVNDVAPTVTLDGPATAAVGSGYTISLSSVDPGNDPARYWLIDWGDRTTQALAGDALEATHVFTSAGAYTVSARLFNADGDFTGQPLSLLVHDPAAAALVVEDLHVAKPSGAAGEETTAIALITGRVADVQNAAAPIRVEYDLNGDGLADGAAIVDAGSGAFTLDLTGVLFAVGLNTITVWAQETTATVPVNPASAGQVFSFTYAPVTPTVAEDTAPPLPPTNPASFRGASIDPVSDRPVPIQPLMFTGGGMVAGQFSSFTNRFNPAGGQTFDSQTTGDATPSVSNYTTPAGAFQVTWTETSSSIVHALTNEDGTWTYGQTVSASYDIVTTFTGVDGSVWDGEQTGSHTYTLTASGGPTGSSYTVTESGAESYVYAWSLTVIDTYHPVTHSYDAAGHQGYTFSADGEQAINDGTATSTEQWSYQANGDGSDSRHFYEGFSPQGVTAWTITRNDSNNNGWQYQDDDTRQTNAAGAVASVCDYSYHRTRAGAFDDHRIANPDTTASGGGITTHKVESNDTNLTGSSLEVLDFTGTTSHGADGGWSAQTTYLFTSDKGDKYDFKGAQSITSDDAAVAGVSIHSETNTHSKADRQREYSLKNQGVTVWADGARSFTGHTHESDTADSAWDVGSKVSAGGSDTGAAGTTRSFTSSRANTDTGKSAYTMVSDADAEAGNGDVELIAGTTTTSSKTDGSTTWDQSDASDVESVLSSIPTTTVISKTTTNHISVQSSDKGSGTYSSFANGAATRTQGNATTTTAHTGHSASVSGNTASKSSFDSAVVGSDSVTAGVVRTVHSHSDGTTSSNASYKADSSGGADYLNGALTSSSESQSRQEDGDTAEESSTDSSSQANDSNSTGAITNSTSESHSAHARAGSYTLKFSAVATVADGGSKSTQTTGSRTDSGTTADSLATAGTTNVVIMYSSGLITTNQTDESYSKDSKGEYGSQSSSASSVSDGGTTSSSSNHYSETGDYTTQSKTINGFSSTDPTTPGLTRSYASASTHSLQGAGSYKTSAGDEQSTSPGSWSWHASTSSDSDDTGLSAAMMNYTTSVNGVVESAPGAERTTHYVESYNESSDGQYQQKSRSKSKTDVENDQTTISSLDTSNQSSSGTSTWKRDIDDEVANDSSVEVASTAKNLITTSKTTASDGNDTVSKESGAGSYSQSDASTTERFADGTWTTSSQHSDESADDSTFVTTTHAFVHSNAYQQTAKAGGSSAQVLDWSLKIADSFSQTDTDGTTHASTSHTSTFSRSPGGVIGSTHSSKDQSATDGNTSSSLWESTSEQSQKIGDGAGYAYAINVGDKAASTNSVTTSSLGGAAVVDRHGKGTFHTFSLQESQSENGVGTSSSNDSRNEHGELHSLTTQTRNTAWNEQTPASKPNEIVYSKNTGGQENSTDKTDGEYTTSSLADTSVSADHHVFSNHSSSDDQIGTFDHQSTKTAYTISNYQGGALGNDKSQSNQTRSEHTAGNYNTGDDRSTLHYATGETEVHNHSWRREEGDFDSDTLTNGTHSQLVLTDKYITTDGTAASHDHETAKGPYHQVTSTTYIVLPGAAATTNVTDHSDHRTHTTWETSDDTYSHMLKMGKDVVTDSKGAILRGTIDNDGSTKNVSSHGEGDTDESRDSKFVNGALTSSHTATDSKDTNHYTEDTVNWAHRSHTKTPESSPLMHRDSDTQSTDTRDIAGTLVTIYSGSTTLSDSGGTLQRNDYDTDDQGTINWTSKSVTHGDVTGSTPASEGAIQDVNHTFESNHTNSGNDQFKHFSKTVSACDAAGVWTANATEGGETNGGMHWNHIDKDTLTSVASQVAEVPGSKTSNTHVDNSSDSGQGTYSASYNRNKQTGADGKTVIVYGSSQSEEESHGETGWEKSTTTTIDDPATPATPVAGEQYSREDKSSDTGTSTYASSGSAHLTTVSDHPTYSGSAQAWERKKGKRETTTKRTFSNTSLPNASTTHFESEARTTGNTIDYQTYDASTVVLNPDGGVTESSKTHLSLEIPGEVFKQHDVIKDTNNITGAHDIIIHDREVQRRCGVVDLSGGPIRFDILGGEFGGILKIYFRSETVTDTIDTLRPSPDPASIPDTSFVNVISNTSVIERADRPVDGFSWLGLSKFVKGQASSFHTSSTTTTGDPITSGAELLGYAAQFQIQQTDRQDLVDSSGVGSVIYNESGNISSNAVFFTGTTAQSSSNYSLYKHAKVKNSASTLDAYTFNSMQNGAFTTQVVLEGNHLVETDTYPGGSITFTRAAPALPLDAHLTASGWSLGSLTEEWGQWMHDKSDRYETMLVGAARAGLNWVLHPEAAFDKFIAEHYETITTTLDGVFGWVDGTLNTINPLGQLLRVPDIGPVFGHQTAYAVGNITGVGTGLVASVLIGNEAGTIRGLFAAGPMLQKAATLYTLGGTIAGVAQVSQHYAQGTLGWADGLVVAGVLAHGAGEINALRGMGAAGNEASASRAALAGEESAQTIISRVSSANATGEAAIHGNSLLSPRTAYLYRLLDKEGNFLKWGITQNMAKRYPKWFMEGKQMYEYARGSRAAMLRLERELVETMPGPLNHERWAGIRAGGLP